jgi:polyphosphate kinase
LPSPAEIIPEPTTVNDTLKVAELSTLVFDPARLVENAWIDRDLGWLAFNRRVMQEALDERTPLLERLKFLGIVTSNLDEFYMKRVSLLRGKTLVEDRDNPVARGADTHSRLEAIRADVLDLLEQQARCYQDVLVPALAREGIVLASFADLDQDQRAEASQYFDNSVSAALTPLGFDPTHPFPFMSNLSTNWAFVIRSRDEDERRIVRVKVPGELPAWIELKANSSARRRVFVSMEGLIRDNAPKLFPGMTIVSATLFRILRNAEVELDEDDDNLRESIAEALRQRRFEPVVRADFTPDADPLVRQALIERFELSDADIFVSPGLLDYPDLFQIAALDLPSARDSAWAPQIPPRLADPDVDIFAAIDAGDILVHHPYESFDASVERLIASAARDPRTLAIKMTVYRVGDDTPFVRSLIKASEAGRQVACVIELQARFDESHNLHWARELEDAGAHVTFGVVGLKTHTKIALVVQKQGAGLRCYAHIGTGNYHVRTAKLYADVGLLTSERSITTDVVNLFHCLTGHSDAPSFERLLVAPFNMRQRFIALIRREIEHARAGRVGRIIAKLNQIDDVEIILALCEASQAGVQIDLIVRGFCCLRPGVPGWSENVRVRSIIGRFLEHSRIFWFANGSADPVDGDFIIGSADWMFRNLSRRVEAAAPVDQRALRERLWEVLNVLLRDTRQAWEMRSDGKYVQLRPNPDTPSPMDGGTHRYLMDLHRRRATV